MCDPVIHGRLTPLLFQMEQSKLLGPQHLLLCTLNKFHMELLQQTLAKDQSHEADIKAQTTICAQYKIVVALLQEIGRLQRVEGAGALSAKEKMTRLSHHLASLPIQPPSQAPDELHQNCHQAKHGGPEPCLRRANARSRVFK
ncbi:hypothetical protein GUJ93_ZPchr0009g217 [Zizania palustris]|uniref:Uncharacterized protein n=1 Tax=Zizania palustris TaxID=103762 RepID=A0A8J5RLW2_ZIZPA|nr:hypothetical protein GUJ93_ZPchr0009g217 [Zizania palustris]